MFDKTPRIQRKIQCPGQWMIPPTVDVYLYEQVPELKECSNIVEFGGKPMRIKKNRIRKDCFGNKMMDWKKLYDLRRKGIVMQPFVTCSWAIENVFDPLSHLCRSCDKRCKRGMGLVREYTIKRLRG